MSEIGRALSRVVKNVFRRSIDPVDFTRTEQGIGFYEVYVTVPEGSVCLRYSADRRCGHLFDIGFPRWKSFIQVDANEEINQSKLSQGDLRHVIDTLRNAYPDPLTDYTYAYLQEDKLGALVSFHQRPEPPYSVSRRIYVAEDVYVPVSRLIKITVEEFWQLRSQNVIVPVGDQFIVNTGESTNNGVPVYRTWHSGPGSWPAQVFAPATLRGRPSFPSARIKAELINNARHFINTTPWEPRRLEVPIFD